MISYLQDGVSLELTKDGNTLTKSGPGVKPLLELIASGLDYSGASLKDRVTGRAAALLYLYLGIRLVETDLISSSALSLLKEKGIEVSYHQEIPAILNHEILGAHLYCAESHEMINLIKLAMDHHIPYEDLRDEIYTHPTMSEAFNDLFASVK